MTGCKKVNLAFFWYSLLLRVEFIVLASRVFGHHLETLTKNHLSGHPDFFLNKFL